MIRRRSMAWPKLLRCMLTHVANGVAIGCSARLAMIWFDVFGIGTLLEKDRYGPATFLLFFREALSFWAVSMCVAVMNLGEDRD